MSKGERRIKELLNDEIIDQEQLNTLVERGLYDFVAGNKVILRMLSKGKICLDDAGLRYIADQERALEEYEDDSYRDDPYLHDRRKAEFLIEDYLRSETVDPIVQWLRQGEVSVLCNNPQFLQDVSKYFGRKLQEEKSKLGEYSSQILREAQGDIKSALIELNNDYPSEVADVENIKFILDCIGYVSSPSDEGP